ncbi:MAG: lysophospholipid acyltransferase family protein [candidate division KSB1 bacterium]|nr:lysophospholipid acyltransferase family protein [candidate division KSB1 bacterium]MDZ7366442.1 lysophospholipid acyltransferase family protein [candidate division KSB1 bacterium]MDZ7404596.1 lysophospholipid acyltransferase family protein [candidate division KSB1 bacterium]
MIKARHAAWADRIFYPYVIGLFKRRFHAIHLLGGIPETDRELPLLLLPNHSTWWDGFFVYWLNKKFFRRKPYLMMREDQLARYKFFSRLGAYSINPHSAAAIKNSLRYSVDILNEKTTPRPMLCVFPQGELLPWDKRPLAFKNGLETILSGYGGKANLLLLGIKTIFLNEQLPEAFLLFGENIIANRNTFNGMKSLQESEEALLDDLSQKIILGEKGMTMLGHHKLTKRAFDFARGRQAQTLGTERLSL